MRGLERAIGVLNTILIILAGLALLAVMGISVANVVFREMQLRFLGAYELVGYAGAIVAAAALGQTQISKDHVPVDIITRRFPGWLNRAIDVLKYALKLGFAAIVAWQLVVWGLRLRDSGEVSETLKLQYYPFVFSAAGGFAVLACTVALDLVRSLLPQAAGAAERAGVVEEAVGEEVPLP